MTFDKMCREKWIFIACSHGLEIEYTPKPRDEQMDPIVDLFAAAFANSNKAIKDGYDSQIKQYDNTLNGYTKETVYGKKHFFGTAEISQMFESATPELLRKIAGVIAEHGFKDVQERIQKSPWYREFEMGREAERQLKREREWERQKLKTRFNIAEHCRYWQCSAML